MIRDYLDIARPSHWFKNVFVLPGAFLAVMTQPSDDPWITLGRLLIALLSICLMCSSNYTINEWVDAREDRHHPEKYRRPAAAGRVREPLVYAQWLGLAACSCLLAAFINAIFLGLVVTLFMMGIVYNVRPFRTKDIPYGDVLSESANNPIRLLLGWYAVQETLVLPISPVLAYWMMGAFFMAAKRVAEIRHIGPSRARAYRRPFAFYTEERLVVSLVFYATCFAFFGGIFLIRYRVELVLLVPFAGILMGTYMHITFLPNSPVQHPEQLYRNGSLMSVILLFSLVFALCFLLDMPWLETLFETTLPQGFK